MKYWRTNFSLVPLVSFQWYDCVAALYHCPYNQETVMPVVCSETKLGNRMSVDDLSIESLMAYKTSLDPKLGTELSRVYDEYMRQMQVSGPFLSDGQDYVAVDISFTSTMDNERAKEILNTVFEVDVINCFAHMCSVRIPVHALKAVTQIDSVRALHLAASTSSGGLVSSEGDAAIFANLARSIYSVNGSGLLIGVLSDSYNCLGGASLNVLSGDLPSGNSSIVIVSDLSPAECTSFGGRDEGRAMMQVIHDIAPGARLAFRTSKRGQADFAAGILQLASAGCDIIVDDAIFYEEPMFQDGIVAQAVDQVVSQGIPYFSSAGNQGRNSWVAPSGFKSVVIGAARLHQFGSTNSGSPITGMRITMLGDSRPRYFMLQWDEPFGGSRNDIDFALYINGAFVASSPRFNIGYDPVEGLSFVPSSNSANASVTVELRLLLFQGNPPTYMKLIVFGQITSFEFPTNSSTLYGHSNAALAAGVGASLYNQTPVFGVSPPLIESTSSAGGTPILFTQNGTRLSSPVIRNQPRFVGPDGVATTFFGSNTTVSGVYRFFGTSASAPHVAAVAALMLQVKGGNRSLTPAAIYSTLAMTAIDMDDPFTAGFDLGFDFGTGSGLVNASAALIALVPPPTVAPTRVPVPPTPLAVPIAPTPLAVPVAPTPLAVPIAPTPLAVPIAPTPVKVPTRCGLFGWSIFCPRTLCGLLGRFLGFCRY